MKLTPQIPLFYLCKRDENRLPLLLESVNNFKSLNAHHANMLSHKILTFPSKVSLCTF